MPGFVVNGFGSGAPSTVTPYYKYTWEVSQLYGTNIGPSPPPERLPLIYLRDASTPSCDFDKEEIQGTSLIYKFAKSIRWNDVKFTWYDTIGLASIIKSWRRSVWTPENGLASPDTYKRTSILNSYTFGWTDPVGWTMFNSWPSAIKVGELSYVDSDVKQVEVTLSYDWAEDII